MEKFWNKVSEISKKYYKLAFFILIFAVFCYVLNQNSQTLNFYLKRGTILEYSINQNQKINEEKINNELLNLKLKYAFVRTVKYKDEIYDADNNRIYQKLLISLPYLPSEDKSSLFNDVSDFVFRDYPYSKLIDVKSMGDNYSKKYSVFFKFLIVFVLSFCVWACILNLFLKNNFFYEIKKSILSFIKRQKENTLNLIKNTKKRGAGYFLKQLLLDNNDDENGNITKEIISTIVFVLTAVVVIRFFIGELRWIPSESMYPTIKKFDRVYVEKLDYPQKSIRRGDILVFYPPDTNLSYSPLALFSRLTGIFCRDIAFIKRTIGMPGDKFEIKYLNDIDEYRVFINDKALDEPYINSIKNAGFEYPPKGYDTAWTPCQREEVKYCGPFVIPDKKYFMMGDNRGNSADSRFWGFLEEDRIIGRAVFMFWPLSRINVMTDKYIILHQELKDNKKIENSFLVDRYSI